MHQNLSIFLQNSIQSSNSPRSRRKTVVVDDGEQQHAGTEPKSTKSRGTRVKSSRPRGQRYDFTVVERKMRLPMVPRTANRRSISVLARARLRRFFNTTTRNAQPDFSRLKIDRCISVYNWYTEKVPPTVNLCVYFVFARHLSRNVTLKAYEPHRLLGTRVSAK